jgi:hypothetical protein
MTITTKPLQVGAPLDPDIYPGVIASLPTQIEITNELTRAQVELMHAIARHRKAWANLQALGTKLDLAGTWKDSDLTYQKAVSDVKWWREEMNAQAATITALSAMRRPGEVQTSFHVKQSIDQRLRIAGFQPGTPEWAGAKAAAEAAAEAGTVREHVLSWDGTTPPSRAQYDSACLWVRVSGGSPAANARDLDKIQRLISWYERLHGPKCICNDPPPVVTGKNQPVTRPAGWSCPRHGMVI